MTALYVIAGIIAAAAALIVLARLIVGPTLIDRLIASDVMLTTLILVIGAEMVISGHTRSIPLMVVLAATAMLGSGFSSEDEQQRVQSTDLGVAGIKALETYQKKDHRASIAAGIGDRFLVTVEADNQEDTELVKQAVKALDLPKLAAR